MPCLKHFFDPEFDYKNLKPVKQIDGSVDYYNKGYVQSVIKGQVLARWEEEDCEGCCPVGQVWFDTKKFPAGSNTFVKKDGNELYAACNGYVFYDEKGLISVKEVLNIRQDLDLSTGNVFFVGDVIVHGSVKSGLSLQAKNINIKKTVEKANIRATGFVKCRGGIKGNHGARIVAHDSIRINFCENSTIISKKNIIIDTNCINSNIFGSQKVAIKGTLAGGECCSSKYIYVGTKVGGGVGSQPILKVGYNPDLLLKIEDLKGVIEKLSVEIDEMRSTKSSSEINADKIIRNDKRIRFFYRKIKELRAKVEETKNIDESVIIVEGIINVGVEICIGEHSMQVESPLENVFFRLTNGKIEVGSPAIKN